MRLIIRADLDGLTSALFITIMEKIDELAFAHPKDMQDGKVPVTNKDILANLPYHPDCALWFDHHLSEVKKHEDKDYNGMVAVAPSCARVIYDYYLKPEELKPYLELLEITDRVDSAQLNMDDVMSPKDWVLLSYTLDPRSGYTELEDYFQRMLGWMQAHTIEEILEMPEVKDKVKTYLEDQERFKEALLKYSKQDANVVITDQRGVEKFPVGNRFLIYTLFPETNVSARIFKGREEGTTVCAVGHSIFNRTCKTIVGDLMAEFGGGGHKGAGTCQFPDADADDGIQKVVERLKSNG